MSQFETEEEREQLNELERQLQECGDEVERLGADNIRLREVVRQMLPLIVENHRHYVMPGGADIGCNKNRCQYAAAIRAAEEVLK